MKTFNMKMCLSYLLLLCCIIKNNEAWNKLESKVLGLENNKYVPKMKPLLWKELKQEISAEDIYPQQFIEGDIRNDAFVKGVRSNGPVKRGANNGKWEKKIPYMFDASMSASKKEVVMSAIKDFEDFTCLKFISRKPEDNDYMNFVKEGKICGSYIGRIGGKQDLNIGSGCGFKGTVSHEIMHALGFFHEHTRPSRDKFIKIEINNVQKSKKADFDIHENSAIIQSQQNTPYDYYSITHLGQRAFGSFNGLKQTIKVLDDKVSSGDIGQRSGLSTEDIKRISKAYCAVEDDTTTTPQPDNTKKHDEPLSEDDDLSDEKKPTSPPKSTTEAVARSTVPQNLPTSTQKPKGTSTNRMQKQYADSALASPESTFASVGPTKPSSKSSTSSSKVSATASANSTSSKSASSSVGPTKSPSKSSTSSSKVSATASASNRLKATSSSSVTSLSKDGSSTSSNTALDQNNPASNKAMANPTVVVTKLIATKVTEVVTKIIPTIITVKVTKLTSTTTERPEKATPATTKSPMCCQQQPVPATCCQQQPPPSCCQQQPAQHQTSFCGTTTGYPCWPQDFTWSNNGLPSSCNCNTAAPSCRCNCVKVEGADKAKAWSDNYLCYKDTYKNPSLRWSTRGSIPGRNCVHISEPKESNGWKDNYLCSRIDAPYKFYWSSNGRMKLPGVKCLNINEPGGRGWDDNYLCA